MTKFAHIMSIALPIDSRGFRSTKFIDGLQIFGLVCMGFHRPSTNKEALLYMLGSQIRIREGVLYQNINLIY